MIVEKLRCNLGSSVYIENRKIAIASSALCKFAEMVGVKCPISYYNYKFDFGQYLDGNYFQKSYSDRPIKYINSFRKKNKVRELNYISKDKILRRENGR